MEKDDLKKLSLPELEKKKRSLMVVNTIILLAMAITCVSVMLTFSTRGLGFSTFIPLCFLPMVIIYTKSIRTMSAEIKSRSATHSH
jgi:hypothetical protein